MKKSLYAVLVLASLGVCLKARAQDYTGFQDQLDDIKEELKIIHQKVYYDQANASVSVTTNGAGNLSEYDEIIRNLNGKFEELDYKVKQLDERLNTITKDIDTRFKLLEGKPIAAASGSVAEQKRYGASVANGAPKSIVGDAVTSGKLKDLSAPAGAVEDMYKKALSDLNSGRQIEAEQGFQMILDSYPSDTLAGNAQFWLGEIYYRDQDYKRAVVAYKNVYTNYKNGNKGAEGLYKLGLSMQQLGKKAEACAALTNLSSEFPKASADIKSKAKAQASKIGCK